MNFVHLHAQLAAPDFPKPALHDLFPAPEDSFSKAPALYASLKSHIDDLLAHKAAVFDAAARDAVIAVKLGDVARAARNIEEELEKDSVAQAPLLARLQKLEDDFAALEAVRAEVVGLHNVCAALQLLEQNPRPPRDARMEAVKALAHVASLSAPQHLTALPGFAARKLAEHVPLLVSETLEPELRAALKLMGWPKTSGGARWNAAAETQSCECIARMVTAQALLRSSPSGGSGGNTDEWVHEDVWAVAALARPVLASFQFHFCTEKPTNRVDRPEWAVAFCLQALRENRDFVANRAQLIAADGGVCADVWSQFARLLVRAVQARVLSQRATLTGDAALLCHTVDELLVGDAVLLGELSYAASRDSQGADWPLFSTVLQDDALLDAWVGADAHFTLQRLQAASGAEQAWLTVKEAFATSGDEARDFATPASDALLALLASMGARWANLASPQARLRLFLGVAAPLVRAFVRAAQARPLIEGCNALAHVIDGLEDLKLSAAYLALPSSSQSSSSSSPRGARGAGGKAKHGGGGFLRLAGGTGVVTATAEQLIEQCAEALTRALEDEAGRALGSYHRALGGALETKAWTFTHASADLSQEACAGLVAVKTAVDAWERRLNPVCRVRVEKLLANAVGAYIRDCVVLARPFSMQGAQQLVRDVAALEKAFTFRQAAVLRELVVLTHVLALPGAELRRQAQAGQPHAAALLSRRVDV